MADGGRGGFAAAVAAALAIAGKDVRAELRSRTALLSAAIFAALVLVVFNFARDQAAVSMRDIAPGVLWITYAFAGTVALNRAFTIEREQGAIDGLLLAPVPRESIFLGKYLANLAFVGVVELITLPLFVLFFDVRLGGALGPLLLVTALGTVGFVAAGTVFSAMAVRTRFAELMLPILLLPFLVPPVTMGAYVTSQLLAGRPLSAAEWWLRLLAAYDVVLVTVSTLAFPAIVDE